MRGAEGIGTPCLQGPGAIPLDPAASGPDQVGRRLVEDGDRRIGHAVREIRIPAGDRPSSGSRMEGQQETGGADLAVRRVESSGPAAEAGPPVV